MGETPPKSEVCMQEVIEILEKIENLESLERKTPEEIREFFEREQLGLVFSEIVELAGASSVRSAGYKQLVGNSKGFNFVATYYPKISPGDEAEQGIFHAFVMPEGEWLSITTISIPTDTNILLVEKNRRDTAYSSWPERQVLEPRASLVELQKLARLMKVALPQPEITAEQIPELRLA